MTDILHHSPESHPSGGESGEERFPRWLLAVLVCFALTMLTWQAVVCHGMGSIGDTCTYVSAWKVLRTFHPDIVRPPVYPLIMGICLEVFGDWWGKVAVCILQWGCWIAGCVLTWRILIYFGVSRKIRVWTIIALMLFSGGWVFNNVAQTEGFATALMPLFSWQLIRYLQTHKSLYIWFGNLTLLFFIFLKPQFFCLIPVLAVAWIFISRNNRQHLLAGILVPVTAMAMIWLYMWTIKRCYCLENTFSIVTHWNGYNAMRLAGLIKPDEIENPEVRETLRPYLETDPGQNLPDYYLYWGELSKVWHTDLAEVWQHAYELHRQEANAYILDRFRMGLTKDISVCDCIPHPYVTERDSAWYNLTKAPSKFPNDIVRGENLFRPENAEPGAYLMPLYGIATLPFWAAWLIIFAFSALYIRRWIRRKRFPVIAFLISASVVAGYVTAFLGAYDGWGRLVTPYTMLLFIMAAVLFSNVKKSLLKYRQRRAGLLN